MSTKRKIQDNEGPESSEPRERKKGKTQGARQIAIQAPAHVADGTRLIARIAIGLTP